MEQEALLNLSEQMRVIISCALVVAAYLVDFLCCKLLIPVIRKIAARTAFKWDNYLTGGKVLHNIFHLIPPVTFLIALPLLYPGQNWTSFVTKALYIYLIVIGTRLINEFISSLYAISSDSDLLRDKPMKGVYQMLKVLVVCVAVILTLGVLLERDFTTLLAGLGASAAVLMLIFKDTILGLVAGIQLSAHDMLRPGDWIVMEKYGVNGTVEEVTLNTVKVRNWDNTIVTVPPYALVSDSFQNWRGMRECGGRRIKRSLSIDADTVHFCSAEELAALREKGLLGANDFVDEQQVVNLRVFRSYILRYMKQHPGIHDDMMQMVRMMQPTTEGIPLEVYCFSRTTEWIAYEALQSEIFDQLLAVLPEFGLRIFQRPTGEDVRQLREKMQVNR